MSERDWKLEYETQKARADATDKANFRLTSALAALSEKMEDLEAAYDLQLQLISKVLDELAIRSNGLSHECRLCDSGWSEEEHPDLENEWHHGDCPMVTLLYRPTWNEATT